MSVAEQRRQQHVERISRQPTAWHDVGTTLRHGEALVGDTADR